MQMGNVSSSCTWPCKSWLGSKRPMTTLSSHSCALEFNTAGIQSYPQMTAKLEDPLLGFEVFFTLQDHLCSAASRCDLHKQHLLSHGSNFPTGKSALSFCFSWDTWFRDNVSNLLSFIKDCPVLLTVRARSQLLADFVGGWTTENTANNYWRNIFNLQLFKSVSIANIWEPDAKKVVRPYWSYLTFCVQYSKSHVECSPLSGKCFWQLG